MTLELSGIGVTPRSGVGTVVRYGSAVASPESAAVSSADETAAEEMGDEATNAEATADETANDADEQRAAFEAARTQAREDLERERERVAERVGESEAEILDAHRQFVDDPQITEAVEAGIEGGLSASRAVRRAFEDPIDQFEGMDGRMSERADDLRDVRDRLVRILTDEDRIDLADLPEGTVLLADRLAPSDTARLDPERVAGFATVFGGRTSHAAIFARSLGIPAVVGVGADLRTVADGRTVLVDGDRGRLVVDPDEATRRRAAEESIPDVRHERVSTTDGRPIEVAANVGTLDDFEGAVEQGADGVGLFRTEFLFLDRDAPPDEDEQYETYVAVLSSFPDDRVVVRTLDVGGDKPIPYLDAPDETDPFLGERGIRRSLGPDADLFETQLRALLRAAAGERELAVMFPLVARVEELDAALARVESVAEELTDAGIDYAIPELGVMIETPGSAFVAEELASRADFLSIGTNDLTQYVMAASRENARVADLHDPLHPPVLRAIARTVDAGHEADAWVGMCGEMAGDPDLTELLVGLGLDELSASAVTVPDVKANVETCDDRSARELAERALSAETRDEVTAILKG